MSHLANMSKSSKNCETPIYSAEWVTMGTEVSLLPEDCQNIAHSCPFSPSEAIYIKTLLNRYSRLKYNTDMSCNVFGFSLKLYANKCMKYANAAMLVCFSKDV